MRALPAEEESAFGPDELSLARLLAPLSTDLFFERYWERAPLHIERGGRPYPTLPQAPLEEIIWQSCGKWGDVSLGGPALETLGPRYAERPPTLPRLLKAYATGCTIVINDLQLKDRGVALLCRALERDLCGRANVNLYATGPGQSGLAIHYDDEDVLVLQMSGRKHWRLVEGAVDLPLRDAPYRDDPSRDGEAVAYELAPGDLLYIPRGVRHCAFTGEESSCHLTVSLHMTTWIEMLGELFKAAAEEEVLLRTAVPATFIRGDTNGPPEAVCAAAGRILSSPTAWRKAVSAVRQELADGTENVLPTRFGRLSDPDDLQCRHVRLAPDQLAFVETVEDGILVRATAGSFNFPEPMWPMVTCLCSGEAQRIADLPGPGSLRKKLEIVARLLDEGFLVPAD